MTGAEIQAALDGLVADMSGVPSKTANISFRDSTNALSPYQITTNAQGVVNAQEVADVQSFIDGMKTAADAFQTEKTPVVSASEAFRVQRATHLTSINAAKAARTALDTELLSDSTYQTLKTSLDTAKSDAGYVAAVSAYNLNNVSENFSNLREAKGKYV